MVPYAIWQPGPPPTATPLISAQEGIIAKTEPTSARQQLNPESDVSRPDQSRNLAHVPSRQIGGHTNGRRCSCRCLQQTNAFPSGISDSVVLSCKWQIGMREAQAELGKGVSRPSHSPETTSNGELALPTAIEHIREVMEAVRWGRLIS